MGNPKLIDKLSSRLSPAGREALALTTRLAEEAGLAAYVVGGPVRDVLLGRRSLDLDIVVEGEMCPLARALAAQSGMRLVEHPAFLTAVLRGGGLNLDLATARKETYRRPGALPTVQPSSIEDDLRRRDFTINAIALGLTGRDRGRLVDPCGGQADLRAGLLRVLHDASFRDDATRILRAFRYACRFGFALEADTLAWLRRDLPYLATISGPRLHHEFVRIFAEPTPEAAMLHLHEHGALAAIHSALRFERPQAGAFAWLRRHHAQGARASYWPVLAWRLERPEAASLAARLALTKLQRQALAAMPLLAGLEPELQRRRLQPSRLVELLSPFPLAAVWGFAALAVDDTVRQRCLDYLTKGRHVRPALRGQDVIALGIPQGPRVGEALRRLQIARLNGEVRSRAQEERFVKELVAGLAARG